ncbi:MAG: RNA polymerase sigma factor [Planctomycetota bacterium]
MKTDEELFLDAGDGAMAELVGRYERPLYHFLLGIVGDAALAEDLFQETFLRLHRYRSAYDAGSPLRPYVFRIAVNAARGALRRKLSPPKVASLDAVFADGHGETDGPALGERLPGDAPDPKEAGEGEEMKGKVRSAVRALPPTQREVVHLRVFEGLKFREIAKATGVPLATAKSRMIHAIRRLRPVLESYIRGDRAARREG